MKLQIIQLEPYDDVASVRDRLSFVKAERALLVYPAPSRLTYPILARKLDLVLIQREAARRGIRLALVSRDPDVIDAAHDLNISVFSSVYASQRQRWKKALNKIFVDRSDRPLDAPDPHELLLRRSREQVLSPRQRLIRRIARVSVIGSLAAAFLLVAYFLLPAAEVVIYPANDQIDAAVTWIADASLTAIDVEGKRIPAALQTLEVESRASIPTTGLIDVPTTLARGIVVFTNRIESAVEIPQGTILSTPGARPARFRTTEAVIVGAGVGQEVNARIEALEDSAGTRGNIEANLIINIEGDLARLLSVRNPEATQGGSVREQNIVTQADADNLLIVAREKLRQDALATFGGKLGGTQIVVPESIRIINQGQEEATYNAFVGDPADTLTLTLRARVQALIIDEQAARQAAVASLSTQIPPGRALIPESLRFTRGTVQLLAEGREASLFITASGDVAARINPDEVTRRLAGMGVGAALELLDRSYLLDPRRPPEISIFPGFFWQLPALPVRITVRVVQ